MSATFDMCAIRNPAGHIRVTFANRGFTVPVDEAEDELDVFQRIPLLPLAFAPTFVVDRDATFLRVEDAEDFRSTLTTLANDRIKDLPFAPGRGIVQRFVEQDASDAVLEREAADRWYGSVGLWNGRALTRGEPSQWTTMQPVPIPGGAEIALARQFRFEFVQRVPCLEGETGEQCVELTMTTEIAEEERKRAAEALHQSLGADAAHYEFPDNRIELRMVTDPDTLLPYRVHQSRRSGMIMMDGEDEGVGGRRQDEVDVVYGYAGASSPACDSAQ
jgi:hypothetical protein